MVWIVAVLLIPTSYHLTMNFSLYEPSSARPPSRRDWPTELLSWLCSPLGNELMTSRGRLTDRSRVAGLILCGRVVERPERRQPRRRLSAIATIILLSGNTPPLSDIAACVESVERVISRFIPIEVVGECMCVCARVCIYIYFWNL